MNAQTTLSGKGQVVIPKDVRDRLNLQPGDRLDVVERSDGVLLRRAVIRKPIVSTEQILAEMRAIYTHKGPPVSIEDMDVAIGSLFAGRQAPD